MVRDDEPVPPPLDLPDPPSAGDDLPDLLTIPGTRRSLFVRIVCGVLGAVLVLLGVVVWITPLVSGAIPLYLGGAVLLGMADARIARWINRHERRRLPRKLRLWLRPGLRRQLIRAEREAAESEARGEGAEFEPRLGDLATHAPEVGRRAEEPASGSAADDDAAR